MTRVVAALALVLVAAPAHADEIGVPDKAKQLAERGRALHDAGDYSGAIEAFREAYVLAPRPGLLFNLAQAYRLSGDCDDAAFMYRRFLESNPTGEGRDIAETNLRAVASCGHGGLVIATPVPPPPLSIAAQPVSSTSSSHTNLRRAGAGLVLGGAAALVVAGVFAYDAHEASDTVSSAYASGATSANLSQLDANGRRDATVAQAAGIVGGAAAVTGAILYAIGMREESHHLAVVPDRHGGQVRLTWGF
ncbi:MAG TPA: tetratricopeptide repeat protein [Kofleriaceae bacterium]|jgi:tetratricopeptide (TPR) repeat protein